jgi:hypothetical protein
MTTHPDRKNPRADSCKKARYECCLAAAGKAACDLYNETCPELRRTIESSAGIIEGKPEQAGKRSATPSEDEKSFGRPNSRAAGYALLPPQEQTHPHTDQCGFDRNASIAEDQYVCACGYRTQEQAGKEK